MYSYRSPDYLLVLLAAALCALGLITNYPAEGFSYDSLFFKQSVFVGVGIVLMLLVAHLPFNLLRGPSVNIILYFSAIATLIALFFFGVEINGAKSWFSIGNFAVQPVDFVKLVLIIVLARYFAQRQVYIKHIRHVVISLIFTIIPFLLVLQQPDLGSSVILLAIWGSMIFVSGISKRHIVGLLIIAVAVCGIGWQFMADYQRDRVVSFLAPLEDLQTSGYTAYQSQIAIGSGELIGKGIGQGTQSKLKFLPLYESDFVFAAFAEEWGFIGVALLFLLYALLAIRLLSIALRTRTNFESFIVIGVFAMIFSHITLHIGVNAGVLPVTGITLPFISYGGSHLIAEALAIALVLSISRRI